MGKKEDELLNDVLHCAAELVMNPALVGIEDRLNVSTLIRKISAEDFEGVTEEELQSIDRVKKSEMLAPAGFIIPAEEDLPEDDLYELMISGSILTKYKLDPLDILDMVAEKAHQKEWYVFMSVTENIDNIEETSGSATSEILVESLLEDPSVDIAIANMEDFLMSEDYDEDYDDEDYDDEDYDDEDY